MTKLIDSDSPLAREIWITGSTAKKDSIRHPAGGSGGNAL